MIAQKLVKLHDKTHKLLADLVDGFSQFEGRNITADEVIRRGLESMLSELDELRSKAELNAK